MRPPLAALTKLTVFTLVTAMATVVLGMTIANTSLTGRSGYLARFTDVSGLLPGDDVRIAGVRVGSVQAVELVDRRIAQVRFTVDKGVRLPASVTASVLYKNLIGQRYLALDRGPGPLGATLPPGGVIPLERTTPPLNLTVLFNGFTPLLAGLDPGQINRLSFEIVQVLQGQGGTVESLLAATSALTADLADRDRVIGTVITNLNAVLDTVNARDEQLTALIVQLRRLVSGLAADREPLGRAVSSLDQLAGTTAGLVGPARPLIRDDVAALGRVATTLADHEQLVDRVLGYLPDKLNTLSRTAGYGSWFNFYLCGLAGTVTVPLGGSPAPSMAPSMAPLSAPSRAPSPPLVVPLTPPPPAARCAP